MLNIPLLICIKMLLYFVYICLTFHYAISIELPESANLTESGAWCWFADPRAVHYENKTYVGWIDRFGNITVASYDHNNKHITYTTLARGMEVDDHSNPSIHIRPDKHILVFWSGHTGPYMFFRRTVRPLDISEFSGVEKILTNTKGYFGFTYPNPITLSNENNDMYLFWRGGNFNPNWAKFDNAEQNWTDVKTLVSMPGQRPYMKIRSNDNDTIHFAFTDAHPRNLNFTSIFHMYYRNGYLFHTNGTKIAEIGTEVRPPQATLVYNANITSTRAWVHDIGIDADTGFPVITFATIFNISYHRYHYARWTGERWFDKDLVAAGGTISEDTYEDAYTAGITLDPDDPSVVQLSRDVLGNDIHEIERWTTIDGGHNWSVETITSNSVEQNVRPYSPRNLLTNGTMSLLWMAGRYPAYTNFQTRIKYLV